MMKLKTKHRYEEISSYCVIHGIEATAKHFGVHRNTVTNANRACHISPRQINHRRRCEAYEMIIKHSVPYAASHTDYTVDELNSIYSEFVRLSPAKRKDKIAKAKAIKIRHIDPDHGYILPAKKPDLS